MIFRSIDLGLPKLTAVCFNVIVDIPDAEEMRNFDIFVLYNRDPRPSFGRMIEHLLTNETFLGNHQGYRSVVV